MNNNLHENWIKLFSELCYEVFYKNEHGVKLLKLLEDKYFRSPIAAPNKEPSWAYFNEGMNEMIRSFTMGINTHLSLANAKSEAQKKLEDALPRVGRARKPSTRPIR